MRLSGMKRELQSLCSTEGRIAIIRVHIVHCYQNFICCWKALVVWNRVFREGIRFFIDSESDIGPWNQNWSGPDVLRSLIEGPLAREEEEL